MVGEQVIALPPRGPAPVSTHPLLDRPHGWNTGAEPSVSRLVFRPGRRRPREEFGGDFPPQKARCAGGGCMASRPDARVADLRSVYVASGDARKTGDAAVADVGRSTVPPWTAGTSVSMVRGDSTGGAAIGA